MTKRFRWVQVVSWGSGGVMEPFCSLVHLFIGSLVSPGIAQLNQPNPTQSTNPKAIKHRLCHLNVAFGIVDAGIEFEADEQDEAVEVQPHHQDDEGPQ